MPRIFSLLSCSMLFRGYRAYIFHGRRPIFLGFFLEGDSILSAESVYLSGDCLLLCKLLHSLHSLGQFFLNYVFLSNYGSGGGEEITITLSWSSCCFFSRDRARFFLSYSALSSCTCLTSRVMFLIEYCKNLWNMILTLEDQWRKNFTNWPQYKKSQSSRRISIGKNPT